MHRMATLDKSGRIVLPSKFRKVLNLAAGAGVMISVKDKHIEIAPIATSVRQAQAQVRKYLKDGDNLVSLLSEQRKEDSANE